MIRCQNCGREVEDGAAFCPHCGKPVDGEGEAARGVEARESAEVSRVTSARETAPPSNPSNVVAMSSFERSRAEGNKSRRMIFVVVGLAAAVLVAGLAYWASRPSAAPGEERLEGEITVETKQNEGSRFRVTWPREARPRTGTGSLVMQPKAAALAEEVQRRLRAV